MNSIYKISSKLSGKLHFIFRETIGIEVGWNDADLAACLGVQNLPKGIGLGLLL